MLLLNAAQIIARSLSKFGAAGWADGGVAFVSFCHFVPLRCQSEAQMRRDIDAAGVQSPKKVFVRGLVTFAPTVAYLFCLNLPAAFSQPRTKTFSGLCRP